MKNLNILKPLFLSLALLFSIQAFASSACATAERLYRLAQQEYGRVLRDPDSTKQEVEFAFDVMIDALLNAETACLVDV